MRVHGLKHDRGPRRHESLVPVLREQMLQLHGLDLPAHRPLQRAAVLRVAHHRVPDARRDRRRRDRHRASLDARGDLPRLDAQVLDRALPPQLLAADRLRCRVVRYERRRQCTCPRALADAAAHATATTSAASGASATAARIAPRSRLPSHSSPLAAITLSTSSRFDSRSWSMRSSKVPRQMSEWTKTGLRWPGRWTRSVACCSTAGFHHRSKWKTWFAAGRFRPRPPALREMTRISGPPSAANACSNSSRWRPFRWPWKNAAFLPTRSSRCGTSDVNRVYCVNTSALSPSGTSPSNSTRRSSFPLRPSSGRPVWISISGWLHTCFRWPSIARTAPLRPNRSSCASTRGIQLSTVAWYRLACSTVRRQ